jgi:hypothetical protein
MAVNFDRAVIACSGHDGSYTIDDRAFAYVAAMAMCRGYNYVVDCLRPEFVVTFRAYAPSDIDHVLQTAAVDFER